MTALYHIAIFHVLAGLIATLSFLIRWRRRKAKDQRTIIDVPLVRGSKDYGAIHMRRWWQQNGEDWPKHLQRMREEGRL